MLNLGQAFVSSSQFGLTPFDLARPETLEDVNDLLTLSGKPCYLAGGTDVFIQFREGLRPDFLIDLNGVEDLTQISANKEALTIGAGVCHNDGAHNSLVEKYIPGFASAWAFFGNTRIRGMGTIGGNLMARRERYEGPILASALAAELSFLGPSGSTVVCMEDVWDNRYPEGALLTHISVPLAARPRLAYDRSLRPIFTLAAVIWDATSGGFGGRAVMGFEWDRPTTLELDLSNTSEEKDITNSAHEIAQAAFDRFPETFADAGFKKDAGTAVLARLLAGFGERI